MSPDFFQIDAPQLVPEAYKAYMDAWFALSNFSRTVRGLPRTAAMDAQSQHLKANLQAKYDAAIAALEQARAQVRAAAMAGRR